MSIKGARRSITHDIAIHNQIIAGVIAHAIAATIISLFFTSHSQKEIRTGIASVNDFESSPIADTTFFVTPYCLSSSPKVTRILFLKTVSADHIEACDFANALSISVVAHRRASFKIFEVIFPSHASFLSSPRGTPIDFARISKSIGILSARDRNSSPWSFPLQNACESWSMALPASSAVAPDRESPFDKLESIFAVSA